MLIENIKISCVPKFTSLRNILEFKTQIKEDIFGIYHAARKELSFMLPWFLQNISIIVLNLHKYHCKSKCIYFYKNANLFMFKATVYEY